MLFSFCCHLPHTLMSQMQHECNNYSEPQLRVGIPYCDADARHCPPLLQVRFSIQVGGLNVAHTVGVWCVQEEEVRGDDFIANHLYKISHSHLFPPFPHKLFLSPEIRDRVPWLPRFCMCIQWNKNIIWLFTYKIRHIVKGNGTKWKLVPLILENGPFFFFIFF